MVLGGYQIPKHTIVVRHGAINSVHAKYFPNPDEFIPERWIRGNFNKKMNSYIQDLNYKMYQKFKTTDNNYKWL